MRVSEAARRKISETLKGHVVSPETRRKISETLKARVPEAERFWAKVRIEDPDGCWLWIGAKSSTGYGVFRAGGRDVRAHRYAYETLVGPIAPSLTLDHLCRIPACVNPSHLEPVSSRENTLRGETVTAANAEKTHCDSGHELVGENLYVTPDGRRQCRACRAEAHRRARDRKAVI